MAQETEKARLVEQVLDLQQRVLRALHPVAQEEWLGADLTMPQLKTLLLLSIDGPSRMGALASALGVSLATTTGIVDRLVERDLVLREGDPGDRRVIVCSLSSTGQELMDRLWELGQARARKLLEKMTPAKLRLVSQAMEAFLDAASAIEQDAIALDKSVPTSDNPTPK